MFGRVEQTPFASQAYRRVEDAIREIGTLLVAFAPLDVALTEGRRWGTLLLFLLLGASLFIGSLWLERRRRHVA